MESGWNYLRHEMDRGMRQPDDPGVEPGIQTNESADLGWPWRAVAVLCIFVGVLYLTFIAMLTPARSHDWFMQKRNPVTNGSCCYGTGANPDCLPVADEDWWRDGTNWAVRRNGVVYRIPASQAMPTEDKQGRAFACILSGRFLCFFLPFHG